MDEQKNIKKMFFLGYLILFIMLLFLIYLVAFHKNVFSYNCLEKQVSVEGTATITMAPDVANVSFEIMAKETTALAAKESNDAMLIRLNEVLKKYDIKENDLKMNYINIRPYYEHRNNSSEVVGYMAQKTITAKIKKIEQYNSFIDDILNIGVSHVNSVDFTLEDIKTAKDEARGKALEAAKAKAELYAKIIGKKIVDIVEISENNSNVKYNQVSNYRGKMLKMNAAGGIFDEAKDSSFNEELGSISINASVFAIFIME